MREDHYAKDLFRTGEEKEEEEEKKKSITANEWKLKGERTKRMRAAAAAAAAATARRMDGWALFNLGGRQNGPITSQTEESGRGFRRG